MRKRNLKHMINHAGSGTFLSTGWRVLRRISLTQWILLSMVLGILAGWLFPEAAQSLQIISTIFLRLIKCILVPLVFGMLVVGIAGHQR